MSCMMHTVWLVHAAESCELPLQAGHRHKSAFGKVAVLETLVENHKLHCKQCSG